MLVSEVYLPTVSAASIYNIYAITLDTAYGRLTKITSPCVLSKTLVDKNVRGRQQRPKEWKRYHEKVQLAGRIAHEEAGKLNATPAGRVYASWPHAEEFNVHSADRLFLTPSMFGCIRRIVAGHPWRPWGYYVRQHVDADSTGLRTIDVVRNYAIRTRHFLSEDALFGALAPLPSMSIPAPPFTAWGYIVASDGHVCAHPIADTDHPLLVNIAATVAFTEYAKSATWKT